MKERFTTSRETNGLETFRSSLANDSLHHLGIKFKTCTVLFEIVAKETLNVTPIRPVQFDMIRSSLRAPRSKSFQHRFTNIRSYSVPPKKHLLCRPFRLSLGTLQSVTKAILSKPQGKRASSTRGRHSLGQPLVLAISIDLRLNDLFQWFLEDISQDPISIEPRIGEWTVVIWADEAARGHVAFM